MKFRYLLALAGLATLSMQAANPVTTVKLTSSGPCSQGADASYVGVAILNFSLTGGTLVAIGPGGQTTVGRTSFGGVKVAKSLDACSVVTFGMLVAGTRMPSVELRVYDANRVETLRITLTNAYLTDIAYTPGQEGLTLTSEKVEVRYPPSNTSSCWDYIFNAACSSR